MKNTDQAADQVGSHWARCLGARRFRSVSTYSMVLRRVGSALTTICLIAGTDALVTGLRRPISRCSCAARAGVRLQLFPGEDPWEFVRQNARRRAAEHMAMEEAERGEPLSHAYKAAYADLLVDLEVKDAMAGKDRETGWRASDAVPAASLPPPKAAAPGGGGGSTATADAAPTSRSAREQVLQALADSRGMWVDTDAKTEVCARVDWRRAHACSHALCMSTHVAHTRCITLAGLAIAAEQPAAGLRLAEDRARRARAQAAARRGGRAGARAPDAALFGCKVLGQA